MTKEQTDKLSTLVTTMTTKELAVHFGVSTSNIFYWIKKLGLVAKKGTMGRKPRYSHDQRY